MKELSTEEKAKAYDEAIKVAESIHRFSSNPAEIKRMEEIFPRLKESEDEKIKKELLNYLYDVHDDDEERASWIAWLEKQEESSDWSEEDEKKRTLLINILEVNHPNGYFKVNPANTLNMEAIHVEELVSWLKSLRPRSHWKPSDEQMITLRQVISGCSYDIEPLVEIEEYLKKLKE